MPNHLPLLLLEYLDHIQPHVILRNVHRKRDCSHSLLKGPTPDWTEKGQILASLNATSRTSQLNVPDQGQRMQLV